MKHKANLTIVLCLSLMLCQFLTQSAAAASFDPNHIIDDSIFNNADSMNGAQINSFLNQFPGSCISPNSGFTAPDLTGYSPTNGFTYGSNTTAGYIIDHAAQAYDLNPEVLLTTIQKEQSLITGPTGGCGVLSYAGTAGYGCPDGGSEYNYTGTDLYTINGNTITSVNGTCVNNIKQVGFSQQVIHASWLLKFGEMRSEGSIGWSIVKTTTVDNGGSSWISSWDNSDDPQNCYDGPMTQGTWQICPSGTATYYDGYTTIDSTSVHMDDGATASLYWYTPHMNGNTSFYNIFTQWFGSPFIALPGTQPSTQSIYARSSCTIPNYSSDDVGRLYQPDTQDFLYTTSSSEACSAVQDGYIWDGVVMQSVPSVDPDAEPVYRLANDSNHLFTTSTSVMNTYLTQYGYHSEGIGFYVYDTDVSGSLPITELTNGDSTFLLTDAVSEANYYQTNYGFSSFGTAFYTPNMNQSAPGTTVIYRLNKNNQRLYTIDPTEVSMAQSDGYSLESNLGPGDEYPNQNNLPVYRLLGPNGEFLYTISIQERDLAVIDYGYLSEGVGFYDLQWSNNPIYRSSNYLDSLRLYTNSLLENNQATSEYGYTREGISWYSY